MHQSKDSNERRNAWRAFFIFLTILILFSAVFESLMAYQGKMTSLLVTGIMWSPGIAAILTTIILKRKIASLPWRWGQWRWNWEAYLLPIVYGLAIYLPVWFFNLGDSSFGNQEALVNWSNNIIGEEAGISMLAVFFGLFLTATLGLVGSASRALGEEIGWRGFLIWEMRKVMPFWVVGLLSGLIWGLWHWPAILLTDYNAGEGNLVVQMFMFTMAIAPMGIIYAYYTFKSKSLWPAVILHASHNLFIQAIFTPLTIQGSGTHQFIDEFGIMMPITSTLLAVYFYRRAKLEGIV